jgi:hypothetical protein
MFPPESFSAPTTAFVELLTKVDDCHRALEPKVAKAVTLIFVFAKVSVIVKTLLEPDAPTTVRNVAVPV